MIGIELLKQEILGQQMSPTLEFSIKVLFENIDLLLIENKRLNEEFSLADSKLKELVSFLYKIRIL